MGVTDDEMDLGALDRGDDGIAVGKRQRHRLFQDDVLAVLGRQDRVSGVELVRRRDIDHVDRGIGDQRGDVGITARVVVAGEGLARRLVRIGRGLQHKVGMVDGGVHHHGPRHAETGDAETDRLDRVSWALRHRRYPEVPAASRLRCRPSAAGRR